MSIAQQRMFGIVAALAMVAGACSSAVSDVDSSGPTNGASVPEVIAHIDTGEPDEYVGTTGRQIGSLATSTTTTVAAPDDDPTATTTAGSNSSPTTTPTTTASQGSPTTAPGATASPTTTTSASNETTTTSPTTTTTTTTTTTAATPVPTRIELPTEIGGIEGVAADAGTGRVFVGDMTTGDVWAGRLDGQPFTLFAAAGSMGRTGVLGLAVDTNARRLYAVSHLQNRVDVISLDSGAAIASIVMPGAGQLNDVAVASNGVVYVTDMGLPRVYRIAAGSSAGELWVDYSGSGIVDTSRSLHGNGVVADNSQVLVASMIGGELLRFDRTSGAASAVAVSGGIAGRDGLALCGNRLLGVDNSSFTGGSDRILVTTLNGERTSGSAHAPITHGEFSVPSTVARLGTDLVVANAQFGVATRRPFWLTVVASGC